MNRWVLLFAVSFSLVGCGKEIGRVALTGEGEGDATVSVAANDTFTFWTSLNSEWTGTFSAKYDVVVRDTSGATISTTTCDPFAVSTRTSAVITELGAHHTTRYQGKMECSVPAPTAGSYTIHAKLTYTSKPIDLKVKDISFVVKI